VINTLSVFQLAKKWLSSAENKAEQKLKISQTLEDVEGGKSVKLKKLSRNMSHNPQHNYFPDNETVSDSFENGDHQYTKYKGKSNKQNLYFQESNINEKDNKAQFKFEKTAKSNVLKVINSKPKESFKPTRGIEKQVQIGKSNVYTENNTLNDNIVVPKSGRKFSLKVRTQKLTKSDSLNQSCPNLSNQHLLNNEKHDKGIRRKGKIHSNMNIKKKDTDVNQSQVINKNTKELFRENSSGKTVELLDINFE